MQSRTRRRALRLQHGIALAALAGALLGGGCTPANSRAPIAQIPEHPTCPAAAQRSFDLPRAEEVGLLAVVGRRLVFSVRIERERPSPHSIDARIYDLDSGIWNRVGDDRAPDFKGWPSHLGTVGDRVVFTGTGAGDDNQVAILSVTEASWAPLDLSVFPQGKAGNFTIMAGSFLLVWPQDKGWRGFDFTHGYRYDIVSGRAFPISTNGAPFERTAFASAVVDGELVIWGGNLPAEVGKRRLRTDGAVYDPATDRWTPVASAGAPPGRLKAVAQPIAHEMVVLGGYTLGSDYDWPSAVRELADGFIYRPRDGRWTPLPPLPDPAMAHGKPLWTGTHFIVHTGERGWQLDRDGGRWKAFDIGRFGSACQLRALEGGELLCYSAPSRDGLLISAERDEVCAVSLDGVRFMIDRPGHARSVGMGELPGGQLLLYEGREIDLATREDGKTHEGVILTLAGPRGSR